MENLEFSSFSDFFKGFGGPEAFQGVPEGQGYIFFLHLPLVPSATVRYEGIRARRHKRHVLTTLGLERTHLTLVHIRFHDF